MTQDLTWQEQARCAVDDPEILNICFNDEDSEIDYTDAAKEICSQCPVRRQCLQYALDNEERFGVWGGADESTRRWALSIDQYGKPIQRIRNMKCPYCSSAALASVSKTRTRTQIRCTTCQLTWWSRKITALHSIDAEMEDDSDDMGTSI